MGKVVYEGDDFKRMLRTDMLALQRIVDAKKFGIHEIKYKEYHDQGRDQEERRRYHRKTVPGDLISSALYPFLHILPHSSPGISGRFPCLFR